MLRLDIATNYWVTRVSRHTESPLATLRANGVRFLLLRAVLV